MGDLPPRRPADLTPAQLGFVRQRPVAWLAPALLAGTAVRVVLGELFGAYLDKRELQAALPQEVHDHSAGDELWLDYVADLGDGFNATYSIASLLARPQLTPDGADESLPRGRVLVMGGDQVYPTASWRSYEERTKGPYQAALPVGGGNPPTLYALPGNHDWYDGLTAFLRLFGKQSSFGGWQTRQTRSYFALSLPQRWWLFAIDAQLDAYLDDPQLKYFQTAAEQLQPGDRVIVCTARPTWVAAAAAPDAYDTLDYFIRKVIEPTGAQVPLLLSGDLHHYSRYCPVEPTAAHAGTRAAAPTAGPTGDGRAAEPARGAEGSAPRTLLTCGMGGAYLSPTHLLPEHLTVPPPESLVLAGSESVDYKLVETYPTQQESRKLSWGVFGRVPFRNTGFVSLLGALHTLMFYAFAHAGTRILTAPVIAILAVVFGGTLGLAMPNPLPYRRPKHWILGAIHGLVHVGFGVLGTYIWLHLPLIHLPGPLPVLVTFAIYLPIAGLVATELTAAYLLVASWFGVNANELFAGQGIQDHKAFLRLHIDTNGALTVYPIAVDEVGRRWQADPNAAPDASWIVPDAPLKPRLIEAPLHLGGGRANPPADRPAAPVGAPAVRNLP